MVRTSISDMVVQCAGNAARGMSLAALHNGGGTGGKAINGGFRPTVATDR